MKVLKAGKIVHNPELCTACGICEVMCSLWNEGTAGPVLARCNIKRAAFTAAHNYSGCRQCDQPHCYSACPLQDIALCIDVVTGVTYINGDECTGCLACLDACPFDPPGVKFDTGKGVAFKCDLCRDRDGGPICVEYCPFKALTYITNEEYL